MRASDIRERLKFMSSLYGAHSHGIRTGLFKFVGFVTVAPREWFIVYLIRVYGAFPVSLHDCGALMSSNEDTSSLVHAL
jgi:hypothetical protein